jgi:hypothetical protein
MQDLTARVNTLIERYFEGNVLRAAQAWRVPQPTVHRLAAGHTKSPRGETLRRIAKAHGTTVEWLLTGVGPSPLEDQPLPWVEYRDFEHLVNWLDLSPRVRQAVINLPQTTSTAHSILCHWGFPRTPLPGDPGYVEQEEKVIRIAQDAAYKAAALQYLSWGALLDGFIRAYGRERVREKLESELLRARLGFHPAALEMLWLGDETKPCLEALERRLELETGDRFGVTMIDWPPIPPLNAVTPTKPKRGRPRKTRPVHLDIDRE